MGPLLKSSFIPSIYSLRSFSFTSQYFALYGEIYSALVTGDDVDVFDPVSLLIIFFNGVVSVDVYVVGGVDGSCVFQSTGGSSGGADGVGFLDAVNTF